jgi:hypothetical protein
VKRLLGLATVLVLAAGTGARAECYPPNPNNGQGHVDRSQVAPGECVMFSGTGFRPKSTVFVDDNGAPRGTSQADSKGEFSKQVCFDSKTKPGQHELSGTGPSKGGDCGNGHGNGPAALGAGFRSMSVAQGKPDRTVRATVYVLGAGKVAPPDKVVDAPREGGAGSGSGGSGGGLPFTGDMTLLEGALALVLILFGAATLAAARPRRRSSSPA